ncbi:hypothetical protein BIV25_36395 [Streptomyces sp. MUSC 14]|uniref:hypothetical protein n=1 Tax=Streptomyces sp. MUSC 14 TaxID=1354889 RepID=UPI0008F56703|nr:hypothetical protein [Streptomyces sp. MUSC 14]OIJ88649.1 hypothetical protein BIV25_36395 [Streptomyces sp. MUSC 14]
MSGSASGSGGSTVRDPELEALIRRHVAARRREHLRQATERSLMSWLLGPAPAESAPARVPARRA